MVSLLIIGLILPYDTAAIKALKAVNVNVTENPIGGFYWGAVIISAVALIWAVWRSKHESPEMTAS